MTNPSATNRPTPTPRSMMTLSTALRQSQPSRTSSQARIPSPATLGKTCAKNMPIVAIAIIASCVIRSLLAVSASTMLCQRIPTSGICSITIRMANATQRKSSIGTAGKTWLKSVCHERYQKHTAVTSSLAAKIAISRAPAARAGRIVSRSLDAQS